MGCVAKDGSGIRRAKDALSENKSPELKFCPENDVDNYTNAVIGINAEFLKVFSDSTTKETSKETSKETMSIQEQIVLLMQNNPKITAKKMASEINEISVSGVRYHINKLKENGVITRVGSTKSGKWIVLK